MIDFTVNILTVGILGVMAIIYLGLAAATSFFRFDPEETIEARARNLYLGSCAIALLTIAAAIIATFD